MSSVSLGRSAVRGAVWTISSSIGSRALGLVGTLLITRFIAPDAYGEVMVAAVLVMTAQQVSTLGLGQYLIAHPRAGRGAAFQATAYHLLLGVLALGLLLPLGPALGGLLDAPSASRFLPGLLIAALLDRLAFVPERLLVRDLRFGAVSAGRSAGDVAYSVGSVALAAAGWGAMAIVFGNLLRSAIRALVFIGGVERGAWLTPCRPDRETTRAMLAYGVPLSIGALAAFASRRWDNLLVAGYFGAAPAGLYNLAYNLADVPAIQVGEQIGDVLFPSFARLSPERRERALLRSMTLLALIVFPLAVGLGAVADTLVRVLFDERWEAVGPMLTLLSALSITRPIGWVIASYLQAQRRTKTVMVLEALKAMAVVALVATLGRSSVLHTCAAVGIGFALHTLASLWAVARRDGVTLGRSLASLVGPSVACIPMVIAVLVVRRAMAPAESSALLQLGLEILAGALSYVAAALIVARGPLRDLLERFVDAIRSRRS
jgi:PST family polysaccharide transporter